MLLINPTELCAVEKEEKEWKRSLFVKMEVGSYQQRPDSDREKKNNNNRQGCDEFFKAS
jgi:hypothetical protein